MRCKYLRSFALSTAVVAVTTLSLWADEGVRQPIATSSSGEIRVTESPAGGVKDLGAVEDSAATSSTPSKVGIPTPAKRKRPAASTAVEAGAPKLQPLSEIAPPAVEPAVEDSAAKQTTGKDSPQSEATPADQPQSAPADEPLQPIPDAMESGPISIEAASFNGVTPGVSTQEEVEKAWGQPKEIARQDDAPVQLYSVGPFNRIEVNYNGKTVASVIVRFDRPFPADAVAKQLDLATVRPVLVSNELGEVLGLAYPERGVLFAFEAGKAPSKPSMKVAQLVLEPISAEPFVLRAETTLENRCDLSLRDLEQALSLEPDNSRAHWLHSRVLVAMEQYEKAAAAAAEAVRLDPENPHYRVTHAQVLAQSGRLADAVVEAQKAVESSQKRPHVKARALCLAGDLTASGSKPDYKKALSFHTQAIILADPLTADSHPAIRVAAKEVLIDAHLGAAHDIAWGNWKEKEKAVARWLERAAAVADDIVKNEGGSREQIFRVQVRAMAACVGVRGEIDPEPMVKAAVAAGDELIAAARDPVRKAQLQWDLGLTLYDAVQICQMRSDYGRALKFGQQAAEYLAKADQSKQSPSSAFLLGRLYFRLGAIHALGEQDHRAAVEWFDKAVPLLERTPPEELAADLGRHGESLVSMGVSYWEAGQRQKAVDLTEKGIKLMEQAAKQGSVNRSSLAIPYNNLAAMHRALGATDLADRFQEMAGRVKTEKLK